MEGYYLPDLETMPVESEYVGKVKVARVDRHRLVVTNCRCAFCVQKKAKNVWMSNTRRDLVRAVKTGS